jgi:hypothetical protein
MIGSGRSEGKSRTRAIALDLRVPLQEVALRDREHGFDHRAIPATLHLVVIRAVRPAPSRDRLRWRRRRRGRSCARGGSSSRCASRDGGGGRRRDAVRGTEYEIGTVPVVEHPSVTVSKVDEQVGANVKSSGLSAKNCWLLSPNLLATGPQLSLFAIVYHALHP